jgi:hypothetical protein
MPGKIDWSVNVTVAGGPTVSLSRSITADAYDKIDVTIPPKAEGAGGAAGTATVSVQPSDPAKVKFLLITSSIYPKDNLTYKLDGSATVIKLDQPQLLAGSGLVGLLGDTKKNFIFTNAVDPPAQAVVQILVGRDAT